MSRGLPECALALRHAHCACVLLSKALAWLELARAAAHAATPHGKLRTASPNVCATHCANDPKMCAAEDARSPSLRAAARERPPARPPPPAVDCIVFFVSLSHRRAVTMTSPAGSSACCGVSRGANHGRGRFFGIGRARRLTRAVSSSLAGVTAPPSVPTHQRHFPPRPTIKKHVERKKQATSSCARWTAGRCALTPFSPRFYRTPKERERGRGREREAASRARARAHARGVAVAQGTTSKTASTYTARVARRVFVRILRVVFDESRDLGRSL